MVLPHQSAKKAIPASVTRCLYGHIHQVIPLMHLRSADNYNVNLRLLSIKMECARNSLSFMVAEVYNEPLLDVYVRLRQTRFRIAQW